MPQKNKAGVEEKPELFSDETVDEAFLNKYRDAMTGKHFKFIISPENQNADCAALVKTLTLRMEAVTGYRFSWLAAVHTDTAHKHAHLLINGVDKAGRNVIFDRAFIKQTMREMSRRVCTDMLGKRTEKEIRAERESLHKRNRYCELDDELRRYEWSLGFADGRWGSAAAVGNNAVLRNRLEHLAELGFAERRGRGYWLERGWVEKLRAVGRYNSFLRARNETRYAAGVDLTLYDAGCGKIAGTVTRRYVMNDEESWNNAVVIEDAEAKKAWYAPLYFEPAKEWLGAKVECETALDRRGFAAPRIRIARVERGRER
jgi:hypothetical protein